MHKKLIAIIVLALAGIAASSYALYLHYHPDTASFCNISGTLNCDVVNQSWASQIAGVPVALIGIVGYGLLALGSMWLLLSKKLRSFTWGAIGLASLGALGFALFLTGVEIFDLQTYCLVCLGSQAIILALTWIAWSIPELRQGVRSWFFSSVS